MIIKKIKKYFKKDKKYGIIKESVENTYALIDSLNKRLDYLETKVEVLKGAVPKDIPTLEKIIEEHKEFNKLKAQLETVANTELEDDPEAIDVSDFAGSL